MKRQRRQLRLQKKITKEIFCRAWRIGIGPVVLYLKGIYFDGAKISKTVNTYYFLNSPRTYAQVYREQSLYRRFVLLLNLNETETQTESIWQKLKLYIYINHVYIEEHFYLFKHLFTVIINNLFQLKIFGARIQHFNVF